MQTHSDITKRLEILEYTIKRAEAQSGRHGSDEVLSLLRDQRMLEGMLEAIPTSIDMDNPDECEVWIGRYIADYVTSFNLEQLAWFWSGYRFGYRDNYYRREWTNRLEKHGYAHFLGHMDSYSRKSWKYLHDIWFDVTYMNTKPSVDDRKLSLEEMCYADLRDRLIMYHGEDDFIDDTESWYKNHYLKQTETITLSDEMVKIPIENDDEVNDMKRMEQAMKGVK